MANKISPEKRSQLMAQIKGRSTKPELILRHALWARGLRYRLHPKLPGRPDVVFTKAKVAVFIDGCFWHGCPLHGHIPKSNQRYWKPKLARNHARDLATNQALIALGWLPMRFWEHEIKGAALNCVEQISESINLRS